MISGALELPPAKKSFLGCVQPSSNFVFTESPLPADFQRGNLTTLRPETHSSCRYPQPSCNRRSGKKRIVLLALWITHYRTTPKIGVMTQRITASKQAFKIDVGFQGS